MLTETFVLNQITGLIDRGHQVDIYAEARGDTVQMHREVSDYGLLEKTRWALPVPANRLLRLCKALWLCTTKGWKKPLCILRCLNFFKYGRRALSLRLLYMAMPYLDAKTYDIIQCHFGPNGVHAERLRRVGAIKGKIVTTFHAYDIYRYPRQKGNGVYKKLFEQGEQFFVVSQAGREELVRMGCPVDRTIIHRMGINPSRFGVQHTRTNGDGEVVIATTGRLVEKKGIEYGIRAIAELRKRYPNLTYKIAGDGSLKAKLEKLVRQLGLEGSVKLLGWQSNDQIRDLLGETAIVLAPSVTSDDGDKEGIPVAIMEAMAAGLPVVTTLHSGIPELVTDGVCGFLVKERNVKDLVEKTGRLLEDRRLAFQMGMAGRDRIRADYNIDKLNDRLLEIYNRLCHIT